MADPPRAVWVPGYDWEEAAGEPAPAKTMADLEAERLAQLAEREARSGFQAWRERILAKRTPRTIFVFATPDAALPVTTAGVVRTPMRVLAQVGGLPAPDVVNVVQSESQAEPGADYGLHPHPSIRYFLAGTLSNGTDLQLLTDYQDLTTGWAVEAEPGVFVIPNGPHRVTEAQMATVGD